MAHNVEPKMDELKRLLRRLDGLDGGKSAAKAAPEGEAEAEQRGYVGALRGAPVTDQDDDFTAPVVPAAMRRSSNSAIYVAAAAAAVVSTATVYLVMSWQGDRVGQGETPVPSTERAAPSKLDFRTPQPGSNEQPRQSNDQADGLVRRAEQLLGAGDVATARILLEEAVKLGSGPAALRLGRSYDPAQAGSLRYADTQTNPDLAKAWYERALALGTQEAAGYISDPGAR
jgi:TPR repeat protein